MTAPPAKYRMTQETSNRMSGARCSFVLLLMLSINAQTVRTMNVHRLKRLTKDDICYGTNKTVTFVGNFSKISTTFEKRMREQNCGSLPKCNGEPLVYHCLRFKEGIVEVCSPKRVIKGSYCVVFDDGIGRVIEDFNRPCSECPFKYPSADSFKYPSCVREEALGTANLITTTTTSPPKMNSIETSRSPCCNSKRCKRDGEGCSNKKTKTNRGIFVIEVQPAISEEDNSRINQPASSDEEDSFPVLSVAISAPAAFIITISLVIFVFKRRKHNGIQKEKQQKGLTQYNTQLKNEKNTTGSAEPLISNEKPDIANA